MGLMGPPSAAAFVVAGLLWLVLGVLPGFLIVSAFDPARSLLDRAAIAPLVSLGVAFAVAAWTGALHVPGSVWWAPATLVAASIAAAVVLVRRRVAIPRRAGSRAAWSQDRRRTWFGVGGAVAISFVLWMLAFSWSVPGWSAEIPSSDGATHGIMVTDILRGGSIFTAGADGPVGPMDLPLVIYPLGLHVLAAPIGAVTTVSSALLVPMTVMSSTWLILGVVALSRRIATPRQAIAAGVAAAFLAPFFPYRDVYWGPAPLVLAVSLVPAASIALMDVYRRRGVVVPSVALSGLFALHVTEVLVVGGLVGLQQLFAWRGAATVRTMGRMLVSVVAAVTLAAPLTGYLVFAQGASRPPDPSPDMGPAAAYVAILRPYVILATATGPMVGAIMAASVLLVVLSMVGARLVWGRPLGRAVVLVVVGSTGLAALAYVAQGGILTSPWYGNGDRLVAQAASLLPCLLGVGLVAGAERIKEVPRLVLVPTVVLSAGVVVVMLTQAVLTSSTGISNYSVVTPADRTAFAWLTAHAKPGERVLNDPTDGSVWMYESSRGTVAPVFGGRPGGGFGMYPEYASRLHLLDTIGDVGRNAQTQAEVKEWNVRYVFVGERTIHDNSRLIDAGGLAAARGIREVFSAGAARVYEIVMP